MPSDIPNAPGGSANLDGGTGTGSGSKKPALLGLPSNYKLVDRSKKKTDPKRDRTQLHRIDPRTHEVSGFYRAGDENLPGYLTVEERFHRQAQLVNAGLLDPSEFAGGQWDEKTRKAYRELLIEANQSHMGWQEKINERMALVQQGVISLKGKSGTERAKLEIKYTNPTDLYAAADQMGPKTIGRRLTDTEKSELVGQYHGIEAAAQTQDYNASDPSIGGAFTAAPDVGSFLDQQMKTKYKGEYEANEMGQNGLAFLDMLSRGGQAGLPGFTT